MKYIIMCGGKYDGWSLPRQMTKILDEPNISRTIRLLKENGVEDIAISTDDERYGEYAPLLKHRNDFKGYTDHGGCWATAFYPMEDPACYLLGDVVFSPDAIRKIVQTNTGSIEYFASAPPFSKLYIKRHAEPFAFKVVDQKRFRAAVDFVIANAETGIFRRRPIAWELWQVINGENVREINFKNYTVINDYTCDIDDHDDGWKIETQIIRTH